MRKFKSWVIGILACHMLLANPKLNTDDTENTIKLSASFTVGLPLIVALGTLIALIPDTFAFERLKAPVIVAVLVIIFGVSSVTDRIYDRNTSQVRQRADEIQRNPEQGTMWARRSVFKIYIGNVITMAVVITLIKFVA